MAAAQKFVAVFLVCMFVLAVSADASSSIYRACFDPCLPACINQGRGVFACENTCDTECTAKSFKAMKVRSRGSKDKQDGEHLKDWMAKEQDVHHEGLKANEQDVHHEGLKANEQDVHHEGLKSNEQDVHHEGLKAKEQA